MLDPYHFDQPLMFGMSYKLFKVKWAYSSLLIRDFHYSSLFFNNITHHVYVPGNPILP